MQQARLSLPEFSSINIADIESKLDELLAVNRERLSGLTQLQDKSVISWQSFSVPMQSMDMMLEDYWAPVSHLNAVANSDELRDVYQRCIAKLTEYATELGQNTELYACFKALSESDEFNRYTAAQKKWVSKALLDFHLSGVDLDADKKERFKTIKARLAELSQTYSNHVLDATAAWQKNIEDVQMLAGLPDSALMMLKQMGEDKGLEGYLLTLDFPVYQAVITYAENRELRKEIYIAYMTKASDQGPNAGEFDNSDIMAETLQLRQEMAALLGYANYSERSLVTKMAVSVDEVVGFLEDLAVKSKPFAEKDLATLVDYAKQTQGIESLETWDFAFVSELYRQEYFDLSDEKLREYFPLEKALQGMFEVVHRLYGITINQAEEFDSYHDDVRLYHIEKEGEHIASFYLDLFARDKKRGGAWMADCRSRWQPSATEQQLPVAFLTCNFRPATADRPALLGHGEVTTLFHEFGHGLHHMLTAENIAGVSGIAGVEWDAVELPSQFMENWCWQEESIKLISAHYETGEALPQDMLDNMLAAKNFNAGMMMLRQLEFSLFDMKLHRELDIESAEQIQSLLDSVRQQVAVIVPPKEVRFQHGFAHIFSGGYAAGYYSYKWAEILSADAFSVFEEKGLFDKASGESFLKQVLQVGSSRSAAESFKAFRGREPDTQALLKHSGLL